MGLECVYPENQGRNKRWQNNKSHRAVPTRIVCDEAEPRAKNGQVEYGEELALDDLLDITFDDSCIDESLFAPWIMDTPMQHSLDGGSSSSSSGSPPCKYLVLQMSQAHLTDTSDSRDSRR
jgi:hypothetical protein